MSISSVSHSTPNARSGDPPAGLLSILLKAAAASVVVVLAADGAEGRSDLQSELSPQEARAAPAQFKVLGRAGGLEAENDLIQGLSIIVQSGRNNLVTSRDLRMAALRALERVWFRPGGLSSQDDANPGPVALALLQVYESRFYNESMESRRILMRFLTKERSAKP